MPRSWCPRGVDRFDAVGGLVGDQRDTGVEEVETLARLRCGAVFNQLHDRLHAELGHLDGVLLAGRIDDAVGDLPDSGAAAVDRDDDHVISALARGLQRLVRAVGGRLVDRVDDVDVGVLGEQILHGGAATVLGPLGRFVAHDRVGAATRKRSGGLLVAVDLSVAKVDAEAVQEALVTVVVHRHSLIVEEVDQPDHRISFTQRCGGPLADVLPREVVVGRERDIDGIRGIGNGIERDHEESGIACFFDCVQHRRSVRCDQDAGIALRDGRLDRLDLSVFIAVFLAGRKRQADAVGLGGGLRPLLHCDEERVRVRLHDQRDADLVARFVAGGKRRSATAGATGQSERRDSGHREGGQKRLAPLVHVIPH